MEQNELVQLFELGSQLFSLGKDDEALKTFEKALGIAQKNENKETEANALVSLGMLHYSQGDFEKSLQHHQNSAKVFKELNNEQQLGQALKTIGVIHLALGFIEKAVQVLNIAQNLAAKTNDNETLTETEEALKRANRFAHIIAEKKLEQPTNLTVKRSLGSPSQLKNKRVVSIVTSPMTNDENSEQRAAIEELFLEGVEHFDEKHHEQAIISFERALVLAQKINDAVKQADLLTNIAGAYYCMEPFGTVEPKVMQLYQQAMSMYHAEKNLKGEARVLRNLGNVFLNLANNKLAAQVLATAMQLAREAGDNNAEQSALELYNRANQRMNY